MRTVTTIFLILMFFLGLNGCGSSAKKKITEEEMQTKGDARIELTNQYKDCVIKAGGDKQKVKECDSYLDAIKKLK